MLRRGWLGWLGCLDGLRSIAVMPCLVAGLWGQEAAQPETVRVQPHASRWDYPKEQKLGQGHKLHVVETGDTLWDLANKYLGNPYAWPQIWELNQWVKDPHWIYPGDPILLDMGRAAVAQGEGLVPPEVQDLAPGQPRLDGSALRKPELAFSLQDFLQLPYLVPEGAKAYFKGQGAFRIVDNKEEGRHHLGVGEEVYLNGGSEQGVKEGDRFVIVKTVKTKLYHPTDKRQRKPMGDVVQQVGILRVVTVKPKGSVAIITHSLDDVVPGDHLLRFEAPADMALNLRTDTSEPVAIKEGASCQILYGRDDRRHLGVGDMALVDRGSNDGLKFGDMLLGVRYREFEVSEPGVKRSGLQKEATRHYLGQAVIVKVEAKSATCRIVRAAVEMQIGDALTP